MLRHATRTPRVLHVMLHEARHEDACNPKKFELVAASSVHVDDR